MGVRKQDVQGPLTIWAVRTPGGEWVLKWMDKTDTGEPPVDATTARSTFTIALHNKLAAKTLGLPGALDDGPPMFIAINEDEC